MAWTAVRYSLLGVKSFETYDFSIEADVIFDALQLLKFVRAVINITRHRLDEMVRNYRLI